jgi:hypothetical protein
MKDELVVGDPGTLHGTSCSSDSSASSGSGQAPQKAVHKHGGACCDGHHHHRHPNDRTSLLASILPIIACALCPACLGIWAQVLSVVGLGVVITETQHHVLLVVAIAIAFLMSAYRFVRTSLLGPFVLTIVGCVSLGASHVLAEENHLLSWLSIAIILSASIWQRRAERGNGHPEAEATFHRPPSEVA